MKFITAVIHIWFLGIMPLLALVRLVFNPDIYKPLQKVIPGPVVVGVMICGILAIFYIISYSFVIAEFYLNLSSDYHGRSRIAAPDYYIMVASPFAWLVLVYFFNRGGLLMEAVESGGIALISQHLTLHVVHWLACRERKRSGGVLRLSLFLAATMIIFAALSVYISYAIIFMEESLSWNLFYIGFLAVSVAGSFSFFYRNRGEIWKITAGG